MHARTGRQVWPRPFSAMTEADFWRQFSVGALPRSLSVRGSRRKQLTSSIWPAPMSAGGAWVRSMGLVCARALSLISVRDPGVPWAGDMMVDGVIPLGEALRPLGL